MRPVEAKYQIPRSIVVNIVACKSPFRQFDPVSRSLFIVCGPSFYDLWSPLPRSHWIPVFSSRGRCDRRCVCWSPRLSV